MSNDVFPTLPGLQFEFHRVSMHKTQIEEAVSGAEYRGLQMLTPRYTYKASYEFLRDRRQGQDELRTLLGFFNAHHGSFDSWVFNDPDDNGDLVNIMPMGVGDGVTLVFQLVRALGGFTEPVYATQGSISIYLNGVVQSSGVGGGPSPGTIAFVTPPGVGVVVGWTGLFYWRCRFVLDQLDFAKFAWRLWNLQTCDFVTLKPPF